MVNAVCIWASNGCLQDDPGLGKRSRYFAMDAKNNTLVGWFEIKVLAVGLTQIRALKRYTLLVFVANPLLLGEIYKAA